MSQVKGGGFMGQKLAVVVTGGTGKQGGELKPPSQPPFLPAHAIDLLDRRQCREAARGEIKQMPCDPPDIEGFHR
jgi:hypothetical protein